MKLGLQSLGDDSAAVQCISCWVLGQLGSWFASEALEGRTAALQAVAGRVVQLFVHPKKSIQFAVRACVRACVRASGCCSGVLIARVQFASSQ